MPTLFVAISVLLVALIFGLLLYGRKRRNHQLGVLVAIEKEQIPLIFNEVCAGLKSAYPRLDPEDFNETARFLDDEFRPSNKRFLMALPKTMFEEGFPDFWVIDVGFLIGELVRKHSILKPEWKKNPAGVWKLCFTLSSGEFEWDPFEAAEKHFTGRTPDLFMALQLVRSLK